MKDLSNYFDHIIKVENILNEEIMSASIIYPSPYKKEETIQKIMEMNQKVIQELNI